MVESRFDLWEVRHFGFNLYKANTPQDLTYIQNSLSSNLYGISAIVSLPTNAPGYYMYLPIPLPKSLSKDYITSYFQHRYLYIFRHEIIQLPRLAIDYSVSFDTNSASYVSTIVKNQSFNEIMPEAAMAFNELLNDNLNFDTIFYFVENIKIAIPIVQNIRKSLRDTPIKFWKLLNRDFRWNIICLDLFQNIDCSYYKNTKQLKFNTSFIQAARHSIKFVYDFYVCYKNRQLVNEFLQNHRLSLFQLITMLRIQYSSNKSAKNKMDLFFSYIQDKCPVFLDKETFLAYEYFQHSKNASILKKINSSGNQKDLWEKVDNIAWDLTSIRILERLFLARNKADYMIPFFLSFDKDLRGFIRAIPAKAVIFDRLSDNNVTIPSINIEEYIKKGCGNIVFKFFSEEKKKERFSKVRKKPNISLNEIKAEFRELRKVLIGKEEKH